METGWWYANGGQNTGPRPLSDLLRRLAEDQISLETLVWQKGWKDWHKLADVNESQSQILEALREQRRNIPPPLPQSNAIQSTKAINTIALSSATTTSHASAPIIDVASFGTKWLKFWNYFSLPVGAIFGLLVSVGVPALGFIMVPIAILQFAVAYGIHYRKLWAWHWNWVVVVISYISMAIPTPNSGSYNGTADLVVQFVVKVILGGLIWMWPNHVYWKKRRGLFS